MIGKENGKYLHSNLMKKKKTLNENYIKTICSPSVQRTNWCTVWISHWRREWLVQDHSINDNTEIFVHSLFWVCVTTQLWRLEWPCKMIITSSNEINFVRKCETRHSLCSYTFSFIFDMINPVMCNEWYGIICFSWRILGRQNEEKLIKWFWSFQNRQIKEVQKH